MIFSRKIYYTNKPLILTNDAAEYRRQHPLAKGYISYIGAFSRNFRLAFQHLDRAGTLGAIIEDISPEALVYQLHQLYQPVDAGGGVVTNADGGILMIYRRGKWDLPKGKRDEGEAMEDCALREVTEETGLTQLELGEKICDTWHIYNHKNQNLLKQTAWYHMQGNSQEQLVPQTEEAILEARWLAPTEIRPILYKTYDAIKEVLAQSGIKW